MDSKEAKEVKDTFYYWIDGQQAGTDFILTCFCTLTHQYKKDIILYCDGNPPEEEPKMN